VIVFPFLHSEEQLYGKYVTLWQRSDDGHCMYKIHDAPFTGDSEQAIEGEEWNMFAAGAVPFAGEYKEGAVKC
jgi:hypothetical protein